MRKNICIYILQGINQFWAQTLVFENIQFMEQLAGADLLSTVLAPASS